MTMTRSLSEVIPMNTVIQQRQETPVSPQLATFVADELLPMLVAFWPMSASQINGNLTGNGIAYGLKLKGFSPRLVREVVNALDDREPSRQWAPKPQELRQFCMAATNPEPAKEYRPEASIRSLEMQAQVMALNGEISDSEIAETVSALIASYEAKGFEITGRIS